MGRRELASFLSRPIKIEVRVSTVNLQPKTTTGTMENALELMC